MSRPPNFFAARRAFMPRTARCRVRWRPARLFAETAQAASGRRLSPRDTGRSRRPALWLPLLSRQGVQWQTGPRHRDTLPARAGRAGRVTRSIRAAPPCRDVACQAQAPRHAPGSVHRDSSVASPPSLGLLGLCAQDIFLLVLCATTLLEPKVLVDGREY